MTTFRSSFFSLLAILAVPNLASAAPERSIDRDAPLAQVAPAKAKGPHQRRGKGAHGKRAHFPISGEVFLKRVEHKLQKAEQRLEKRLAKNPPADAQKLRQDFKTAANKVRAAAKRAAADGSVTREEAKQVRKLSKELRQKLWRGHGFAKFPVKGPEFVKRIDERLKKAEARLEERIKKQQPPAEKQKKMRDKFKARAAKIRAAARDAARDGQVTREEAKKVRALAKKLRGKRWHHGFGFDPKKFPMPGAEFMKRVDERLGKADAHFDKRIQRKQRSRADQNKIKADFRAASAKVRAAAKRVAADGTVTLDEAKQVREQAHQLRSELKKKWKLGPGKGHPGKGPGKRNGKGRGHGGPHR